MPTTLAGTAERAESFWKRAGVFVLAALAIAALLAACTLFVISQVRATRLDAARTLTAIAELKVAQIVEWHRERMSDASTLARVPNLVPDPRVPSPSSGPETDARAAFLEHFRVSYRYSRVAVFDNELRPLLVQPAVAAPSDASCLELLQEAMRTGRPVAGDLYRSGEGPVSIDFAAPVFSPGSTAPSGAVVLGVDASVRLFPVISRWPYESLTAESILVRREGSSLLYLSPLRHRPGAEMAFRLPIGKASLIAASAILSPESGVIEGLDYRGVQKLAVARRVPGTSWILFAGVDRSEAYAPAWAVALRLGGGSFVLLALAGMGAWLFWRERHIGLLEKQRDTERLRLEASEQLALVLKHANDAILLLDENWNIVEANDRAGDLYGYSSEELLRLGVRDLRAPEAVSSVDADLSGLRKGGRVYETTHQKEDGTQVPVEVSARPVEIGGRSQLLLLVRDISERREHEKQLERLNRMYLALSQINEAIVHLADGHLLVQAVCRILVEAGGFKLAWVGAPGPGGDLGIQAQSGDTTGYLDDIRITVDQRPEGLGPSGTAFREGRMVVINEFLSDPQTLPWRERAAASGIASSLAIPLSSRGIVTGVLTIYAGERGFFGEHEISLAEKAGNDISFGLEVLARDEERRKAEQALKAREEIFSSIVGQALDAIALFDPATGRFVEFNEAAHQGLGHTREAFASLGLGGIQAEHSPEEIHRNIGLIRETGSAIFETRHRHASGEIRAVLVRARQLTLHRQPYIAVVWTDITERKRSELERQALLEIMQGVAAEEDMSSLLKLAHHAVARVVFAGNFFVLLRHARANVFELIYLEDERGTQSQPSTLGSGLPAYVFRTGVALLASEEVFAELLARGEVEEGCLPAPSWLGAPLRTGDRVIGVMAVQDYKTPGRYSERDREFLSSVAAQIAVAIERQRTRDALVENAARLNEAQRIAHVGVWELDLKRNVLFWSDEIYRMFGIEPQLFPATYEAFLEAIHPEDRDYVNEAYLQSLVTKEPYEIDHRLLLKDGTLKVVHERCQTWFDNEGHPVRSVGTVQDITARVEAEAEFRKLSRAVEQSPVSVVITDLDGRIEYVNPRFTEVSGYSFEEVRGKNPRVLKSGKTSPEVFEDLWRTIKSGKTWRGEVINRKKSGELFVELLLIASVTDGAGRPSHFVALKEDISERKAAEAALEASKARLEEAQALANLGSWERDFVKGRLTRSPEIFRIFERDPATWGEGPNAFMEAVHPDDLERVKNAYEESIRAGTAHEIDHRILTPGGEVKWVRARWLSETGPDGAPSRASGTIQDISEHVLAREARNLAEAKEAAEAANRAKSVFLASMSHEIRTPMNAILGFAQLLLGDPALSPAHARQLETIRRSGEHLLGLINDVLEMSKIEAGRATVNLAETDLHGLIWDLESMFQLRAREKGLSLSVERAEGMPRHVVTDEKKLRQILINLMGNAVKFTATGGFTLRVRTEPEAGTRLCLLADVEDTGPGISEDELPRLFRMFEQTRSGREMTSGTGLGLAISRGFALLMGGDLTVRSRVGIGSTFTLSVPVTRGESLDVREKAESRRVIGLPAAESRRRILVVDDVAENREILLQMLSRVGFEVRAAIDGPQALELFFSWAPHLVLMDLRMPGMDGLEVMRRIRARESAGRVPIVAVTASVFEDDRQKAVEAGSDGFVGKPFREEELLQTIGHCLGIRYIFGVEAVHPCEPDTHRVRQIPEELRQALWTAVISANIAEVLDLTEELSRNDPGTASAIRELAEQFEYDRLLDLLTGRSAVPVREM